jgi:hypothetical protein
MLQSPTDPHRPLSDVRDGSDVCDVCDAANVTDELIDLLIHEHRSVIEPSLARLWDYYRNELDFSAGDQHRPYRAAQEQGLPWRLTHAPGLVHRSVDVGPARREVVIENDIAWRIHTLVDFMFSKPVAMQSLAEDPALASAIERVLGACFEANGGICFFQDMALLGSVYGHVDVLLRADRLPPIATEGRGSSGSAMGMSAAGSASEPFDLQRAIDVASRLILETVEAPRAIPVLDPSDYRRLDAYIVHYTQTLNEVEHSSFLARLVDFTGRPGRASRLATTDITEIWSPQSIRIRSSAGSETHLLNPLGLLPVVHIQNLPQPLFYEGLSEVEPLIPLQDELNTRLSDRANRVTLQSFKMYLGKGIENFTERPIGPGQMWMTDNPEAAIETFGGDSANPSEEAHINEIREALDKASGVTAVAAGLLRNKVGNLTSENALRIVMMGLLARTEKKRVSYGKGITQIAQLILHTLHVLNILPTTPDQRRIKLHWPSPLPEDQGQRLRDAALKLKIGVPRAQVLAELGYSQT